MLCLYSTLYSQDPHPTPPSCPHLTSPTPPPPRPPTPPNPAGIGLAVAGAICMVAGGAASASHASGVSNADAQNMLVGDACLLVNTLAMTVYYIVSKQMVARYPAICVAAWAYLVGELVVIEHICGCEP